MWLHLRETTVNIDSQTMSVLFKMDQNNDDISVQKKKNKKKICTSGTTEDQEKRKVSHFLINFCF